MLSACLFFTLTTEQLMFSRKSSVSETLVLLSKLILQQQDMAVLSNGKSITLKTSEILYFGEIVFLPSRVIPEHSAHEGRFLATLTILP